MLTPEEKKQIREMAKMAHSWDVHVSNKGYSFDFTKNTRDAYASGMEAGILQERERILQIFSNCETVHHVEINQPSGSFIFNSLKNKVTNKSK